MFDTLKNAMLASMGLVAMTAEKLREAVDDLVRRGELTADQGRKLVDELLQKGQAEGRSVTEKIAAEVVRLLERSPFATRREVQRLEGRVRALEARLDGAAPEEVEPSGAGASGAEPSGLQASGVEPSATGSCGREPPGPSSGPEGSTPVCGGAGR